MKNSKGRKLLVFGILLVVIDQVIKILVKTNMYLGQQIPVLGDRFKLLFVENAGMAFGMKFGGEAGKYFLTFFRVGLFVFLCWWIASLVRNGTVTKCVPGSGKSDPDGESGFIREEVPAGVLIGLTMITAGALGNIIDCLFYGLCFSSSTYQNVAEFMPALGGYAPLGLGNVVDMFYFPLIEADWPSWMPFIGRDHFIFFAPVFNFADACVSCGAIYLIIFRHEFFFRE